MSSTGSLTSDLSRQLAFSPVEPASTGHKVPKQRHKKTPEKPRYDILQIDEQIQTTFALEVAKVPEYAKRIASMVQTLGTIPMPFGVDEKIQDDIKTMLTDSGVRDAEHTRLRSVSPLEHKRGHTSPSGRPQPASLAMTYQEFLGFYYQLKRLMLKKDNLESGILQHTYQDLTTGILTEYRTILNTPVRTSFLASRKARSETESERRKKELVEHYLRIASDFVNLEYVPEATKVSEEKYVCACGNNSDFEVRDGVTICEQCGAETETISAQSTFKDNDRINTHTKYKYEKAFHFQEAINAFQGKQNKYIDPAIYPRIEQWAQKHNLLDLDATTKEARYAKLTKSHLRLMFSESKDKALTDHHEDIHLIFSQLTGKPCHDISHLEERLNAWFDLIETAFHDSPDIDRTNILHGPFVLAKFLRMCGYAVTQDDFPGLKTLVRQQDHETLFAYLCAKAGLNHPDDMAGVKKRRFRSKTTQ